MFRKSSLTKHLKGFEKEGGIIISIIQMRKLKHR